MARQVVNLTDVEVNLDELEAIHRRADELKGELEPDLIRKGHSGKFAVVRHDDGSFTLFDRRANARAEQKKLDIDGVQRSSFVVGPPSTDRPH